MKELIIIINYNGTAYQYTTGCGLTVYKDKYNNGGTLYMNNPVNEDNLSIKYDDFEDAKNSYNTILSAIQENRKVIDIYKY